MEKKSINQTQKINKNVLTENNKIKINQNENKKSKKLNISTEKNNNNNNTTNSSNENEFPFIQNHINHVKKNSKSLPKILTRNLNPKNEDEIILINKLSNVPLTEREISNINNSLTKSLNIIKSQIFKNELSINSNKNYKHKILSQNQINRFHNVKKFYDKKIELILKKNKLFENLNFYSNSIKNSDKSNVLILENKIREAKKEIEIIENEIKSLDLQIKYEINDELKESKKNINKSLIYENYDKNEFNKKIKKWIDENSKLIKKQKLYEKIQEENEKKEELKEKENKKLTIENYENNLKQIKKTQKELNEKIHNISLHKQKFNFNIKEHIPKNEKYFYKSSEKNYLNNEKKFFNKIINKQKSKMKQITNEEISKFKEKIDEKLNDSIKKTKKKFEALKIFWKENEKKLPFNNELLLNENKKNIEKKEKNEFILNKIQYCKEIKENKQPKINKKLKLERIENFPKKLDFNSIKKLQNEIKQNELNKSIKINNNNLGWTPKLNNEFNINEFKIEQQKHKKTYFNNLILQKNKKEIFNNSLITKTIDSDYHQNNSKKKKLNFFSNFYTEPNFDEKYKQIQFSNDNINNKIKEKSLLLKYSKNKQSTINEISKLMINDIKNNLSLI